VDVSNAETDYVIVVTQGCSRADTLAHELSHIFGGTHAATVAEGDDYFGVIVAEQANAAIELFQASAGASPLQIPALYSVADRYSSTIHWLGDSSHDNRRAVQLTATSVAAYRGPTPPPPPPDIPDDFYAVFIQCSGYSAFWWAYWSQSESADYYELWYNGEFGGPPSIFLLATTATDAPFLVNYGTTDLTVRACLNHDGVGICSNFFTPTRRVWDTCGPGDID